MLRMLYHTGRLLSRPSLVSESVRLQLFATTLAFVRRERERESTQTSPSLLFQTHINAQCAKSRGGPSTRDALMAVLKKRERERETERERERE